MALRHSGALTFQRASRHRPPLLLDRDAGHWQWVGSIFSNLEILPFFAMVLFTFSMVWKRRRDHPNNAALLWSLGCAVLAFFGAGVWGFMHTFHGINYYTHGTQVTAAHAHLAFFVADVCLNLAMITDAMPYLLNREPYNQVLNMLSFWILAGSVSFMTFTLTFAGVLQTHLQRVNGGAIWRCRTSSIVLPDAIGRGRHRGARSALVHHGDLRSHEARSDLREGGRPAARRMTEQRRPHG